VSGCESVHTIVDNPSRESWDTVLDAFPQDNLWQTFEYGEALEMAFPRTQTCRLLALDSSGEPVGAVQGSYSRYFGFGTCLGVNNGPLIITRGDERDLVVESLLSGLEEFGTRNRIVAAQVWWPERWGTVEVFEKLGYVSTRRFNEYMVNLDGTVDDLWGNLHRNKRKNVKRALSEGVEIVEADGHDDLLTFYRLHQASADEHEFPADFYSRFESIWRLCEPSQSSRIFFAKYDGREISGVFTVAHGRTVYALAAGSLSEYWNVRPNDLLHWKVMEWACEHGFSRYYMGLVDDPVPTEGSGAWGIWRWKREWNGELGPLIVFDKTYLPRYRFVLGTKSFVEKSYFGLKRVFGRLSGK